MWLPDVWKMCATATSFHQLASLLEQACHAAELDNFAE